MQQKNFVRLCAHADAQAIEEALNNGASPNERAEINGAKVTPLFVAVMEKNSEAVKVLMKYGAEYVEGLMAAVISDNKEFAKFLVQCGADINAQDKEFHNALLCAVNENKYSAVKWLIELGADVNVKMGGKYNALTYSVLMFSEDERQVDPRIIRELMKAGADYGDAILLAVKIGSTNFIDKLLKNGADINKKWNCAHTPLSVAMLTSEDNISPEMIKFLVKRGANVNEIFDFDDGGFTNPLNLSIAFNKPEITRTLLKYGADPNYKDYRGKTALFYAVITGNKILRVLLSNGADPNEKDDDGRTPLMLAAIDGETGGDIIKTLLEFGADPNIQDKKGLTALIWTIMNRDRSPDFIITALIRTGGFRAKGWGTWCAISYIYAAAKRHIQINTIKILVKNGADLNVKDKKGMTALAYAMSIFDDEITEILIKSAAKTKTKEK